VSFRRERVMSPEELRERQERARKSFGHGSKEKDDVEEG